jgi:hypothetical protein
VTFYFAYEHCVLPSSSSQAVHLHTTRLSAKIDEHVVTAFCMADMHARVAFKKHAPWLHAMQ